MEGKMMAFNKHLCNLGLSGASLLLGSLFGCVGNTPPNPAKLDSQAMTTIVTTDILATSRVNDSKIIDTSQNLYQVGYGQTYECISPKLGGSSLLWGIPRLDYNSNGKQFISAVITNFVTPGGYCNEQQVILSILGTSSAISVFGGHNTNAGTFYYLALASDENGSIYLLSLSDNYEVKLSKFMINNGRIKFVLGYLLQSISTIGTEPSITYIKSGQYKDQLFIAYREAGTHYNDRVTNYHKLYFGILNPHKVVGQTNPWTVTPRYYADGYYPTITFVSSKNNPNGYIAEEHQDAWSYCYAGVCGINNNKPDMKLWFSLVNLSDLSISKTMDTGTEGEFPYLTTIDESTVIEVHSSKFDEGLWARKINFDSSNIENNFNVSQSYPQSLSDNTYTTHGALFPSVACTGTDTPSCKVLFQDNIADDSHRANNDIYAENIATAE